MTYDPQPGDVISYDFLWKREHDHGATDGRKDRPCAIAFSVKSDDLGSKQIYLVPITHSQPSKHELGSSVAVPAKVAKHLGLDDSPCWIRTHELNSFVWCNGHWPAGVVPLKSGKVLYGQMPDALMEKIFASIRNCSEEGLVSRVERAAS